MRFFKHVAALLCANYYSSHSAAQNRVEHIHATFMSVTNYRRSISVLVTTSCTTPSLKLARCLLSKSLYFAGAVLISAFLLALCAPSPCFAQSAYSLTKTDINTSTAGSYTPGPPTYTVGGAGSAFSGTTDSFTFVGTPTTGNVEMIAKVTSQTGAGLSPYAVSGLMMRDSLNSNAAMAVVGVSPSNGVNFTVRTADGAAATTTLGPTVPTPTSQTPVWLRIVLSGSSIAGYEATDTYGQNWVLVGKVALAMPSSYYVGFAQVGNSGTNLCTSAYTNVSILTSVPQRSANMLMWLRADAGVQYSGPSSYVSGWTDQSGTGMNAAQSTTGNQPTLASGINGLPAINFASANNQYLQLGAGFGNFTSGYSAFIVANIPTAVQGNNTRILELCNGGTSHLNDGLNIVENTTTTAALQVCTSAGASPTYASTSISTGSQLIEAVDNGASSATAYTNGVAGTPNNAMTTITNPSGGRAVNFIAKYNGDTSHNFNGSIAEIIVYSTALSTSQRQAVEAYLIAKYGLGGAPPQAAVPTITPNYGVFTATQQATISGDPGALYYYTTDGLPPVVGNADTHLYTGPLAVAATTTIKAIAVQPGYATSNPASATVVIDPASSVVNVSGLQLWLRSDAGVVFNGSAVSQWNDLSAAGKNATAAGTHQPSFTASDSNANNHPVLTFNGTTNSLTLPAGFDFTGGASFFIVCKPTSYNTDESLLSFGTASNNMYRFMTASSTAMRLVTDDSGTIGQLIASGGLTIGANAPYQLLESTQDGSRNSAIYTNGTSYGQGSVYNFNSSNSTTNYIGQQSFSSYYFPGNIAEIIIFNKAITTAQRQAIETYLEARYGLQVNPPVISPATGIYAIAPQTVTITADPGAQIMYTTDGSVPSPTHGTAYAQPFSIWTSTNVQAIAIQSFASGQQPSAVVSNYINIDQNVSSVPTNGLYSWLRSDFGLNTDSSNPPNVVSWTDVSGNGHSAANSTTEPTVLTNAVNGLSAINFGPNAYLNFLGTSANFTSGVSVFQVVKAVPNFGGFYLNFHDSTNTYKVQLLPASTYNWILQIATNQAFSGAGGSMIPNAYQLTEAIEGNGLANFYVNGGFVAGNFTFSNQTNTALPGALGGTSTSAWQIAETLIYTRALNSAERGAVEKYILAKYALALSPVASPIFSVPSGSTFAAPSQVSITAAPGATIFFTQDGSTPSTSSPVLNGPINVSFSQTIKAISSLNSVLSPVSSATYTLDATKWPAPPSTDTNAPKINIQVPTPAQ